MPSGVGWTSLVTAYARAQESRRPDRLFADPWAQALLAPAAGASSPAEGLPRVGPARDDGPSSLWATMRGHFLARTCFFDEQLLAGVAAGAQQVVLLAAGLDARAARLDLPAGAPVFEVDTAGVLGYKAAVLAREGLDTPRRTPVVADLRGDWGAALLAAGFRAGAPTVWLAEGLLIYLDADQGAAVVETARGLSAPGSRVVVDYFGSPQRREDFPDADAEDLRVVDLLFAAFSSGPSAAPARWLPERGFAPVEVGDTATGLRALGRPVPAPVQAPAGQDPVAWLAAGRC